MRRRRPCNSTDVGWFHETDDAALFARALQPKTNELQYVGPSANPFPGALDVLLFRGVLLVAYSAGSEVIIASGSNLATLRRLRHPKADQYAPRAVAFRSSDAALAVSFGHEVVVFQGWNDEAREKGVMYDPSCIEIIVETIVSHTLSWDRLGTKLAVVGEGLAVWNVGYSSGEKEKEYKLSFSLAHENAPMPSSFTIGSISPDGLLLCASAHYSRTSWVWNVSGSDNPVKIVHGSCGVAAMDWKPRGGGNAALMTIERDAAVSLWVKDPVGMHSSPIDPGHTNNDWMREIARAPHAENTRRASASFVQWGGGGGCADDEVDAWASANDMLVDFVVPKPSRCVHWIARVAAGNAQAWCVQGLDDRPKAVYTRLQPGSGSAQHGAEEENRDCARDFSGRPSLTDVSIYASKSVAPVPLTTSTQQKAGLVRSYAISNGERLLRSPEPPNPPTVLAVFVLVGRHGNTALARYDVGATTNVPAVCRARVGIGHKSPVKQILAFQGERESGTSGWLLSMGSCGDVIVWKTEVPTGVRELITFVATLPGPHDAVAFGPKGLATDSSDSLGIFAVDSCYGNLRLYSIPCERKRRNNSSIQVNEAAVLVCSSLDVVPVRKVHELLTLTLPRVLDSEPFWMCCGVLGVLKDGSLRAWFASRTKSSSLSLRSTRLSIRGTVLNFVRVAAACEQMGSRQCLLALGGDDGRIVLYSVSSDSSFGEDGLFTIVLSEIATLGNVSDPMASFNGLMFSRNGTRISLRRVNSAVSVWECHGNGSMWASQSDVLKLDAGFLSVSEPNCPGSHISPSCVVIGKSCGLVVHRINPKGRDSLSTRTASNTSPWRGLTTILLVGGSVKILTAALLQLKNSIDVAAGEDLGSNLYLQGRGLAPSPASVDVLFETEDVAVQTRNAHTSTDLHAAVMLSSKSRFADLMAVSENNLASSESMTSEDNSDPFVGLANLLRSITLSGLSRKEQVELFAVATSHSKLKRLMPSLDPSGARFALVVEIHREMSPTENLPAPLISFALHSSSCDVLMDYFLAVPDRRKSHDRGQSEASELWSFARKIGAGWWVSTSQNARKLVEKIARAEFKRTSKAENAALWYAALGKYSTVAALYKAQQDYRMSKFFLRDFSRVENRIAASKNAYALVSKHRLSLAVTFFILAGDVSGALKLVRQRIGDIQLSILLSRILEDGAHFMSNLSAVSDLLSGIDQVHSQAMTSWLSGNYKQAVNRALECSGNVGLLGSRNILGSVVPESMLIFCHVHAMCQRPPLRGIGPCSLILQSCRQQVVCSLQVTHNPLTALKVTRDLIQEATTAQDPLSIGKYSEIISVIKNAMKVRTVAFSDSRLDSALKTLTADLESDLLEMIRCLQSFDRVLDALDVASRELCEEDSTDAAVALSMGAISIACRRKDVQAHSRSAKILEACLRMAIARSLSRVHSATSVLSRVASVCSIRDLLCKTKNAVRILDGSESLIPRELRELVREFNWSELALRVGVGFFDGNWVDVLTAVKSCESVRTPNNSSPRNPLPKRDGSTGALVSVETLRHMASNPAVLGISPGLGHIRRKRRVPSINLLEHHVPSPSSQLEDISGLPLLSLDASDPGRIHPALSHALCACAFAYLSSHLANSASKFEKRSDRRRIHIGTSKGSVPEFRLVDYAEALEHMASDAIARWSPLPRFGIDTDQSRLPRPNDAAVAFFELWATLGCLPEFAPVLSEAATVAAAELAATASPHPTNSGKGSRKNRRDRKDLKNGKEDVVHLDTTSDVVLHRAYPVRFSGASRGPWSGRGKHAILYKEEGALFRKLCICSIDPPSVIVATPKGIQEVVPSSYTTMPARLRAHYMSHLKKNRAALAATSSRPLVDVNTQENMSEDEQIASGTTSFDSEAPFLPLAVSNYPKKAVHRSSLSRNKKTVWRHQVHATALTSHPSRRRFASGGFDGFVRLWEFSDPLCLASLREERSGRVAALSFSVYANRIMAVYSSGRITLWEDPDNYRSLDSELSTRTRRKGTTISAFDSRVAHDGIFVDERFTIACAGDPAAPPVVGDSIRVFDTREASCSFRASWSAAVHDHGESKSLALLEDRVRLVSGGTNGSLSVVDMRTKGCIAELPAHPDEVTCLAVEWPRGRALASGCRNGDVKIWDSRTLLTLDVLRGVHSSTRHYWSGSGFGGLVGSFGTTSVALTNRSLVTCGGDGKVKVWGPGWCDFDLNVL